MDVYRSLSLKLLLGLSQALETTSSDWFIKTDDDSLLFPDRIISRTPPGSPRTEMIIWGNFKVNQAVMKGGKHSDLSYQSFSYPPYPCGVGYGLSRRLAEALVDLNRQGVLRLL
ncbi:unnamed protein product, partial [Cyprideis torosa]